MSVNNAIAAQLWLWPDPIMKRDAQGRILFINAAFLNLYGGSVEAWTGNVIQGWPAPQPPQPNSYPVPYRFETRMPCAESSQEEQVYDWIEQSEPDGTAFALARNVTPFTQTQQQLIPQAATQPEIIQQTQAPQYSEPPVETTNSHAQIPAQNPGQASTQSPAPQSSPSQGFASEPTQAAMAPHAPAEESASQPAQAPAIEPQTPAQPNTQQQPAFQHDAAAPAIAAQAPVPDRQEEPPASQNAPTHQAAPEREERSFERRALPLEANSSVLGNNWRDAVIAKACRGSRRDAVIR